MQTLGSQIPQERVGRGLQTVPSQTRKLWAELSFCGLPICSQVCVNVKALGQTDLGSNPLFLGQEFWSFRVSVPLSIK